MNKSKKNIYVCQRCAMEASTCCRIGHGENAASGEDCFPLSAPEHRRIKEAISKARGKRMDAGAVMLLKAVETALDAPTGQKNWAVDEANSESFIKAMHNLFPKEKERIEEVFSQGASHLRLALDKSGACAFLSEHGCTLPRQARPGFCRIFPFWSVHGVLQCFQAEDCLAVKEHDGKFMALMGAFDSSPADIGERYKKLRKDWGIDE